MQLRGTETRQIEVEVADDELLRVLYSRFGFDEQDWLKSETNTVMYSENEYHNKVRDYVRTDDPKKVAAFIAIRQLKSAMKE